MERQEKSDIEISGSNIRHRTGVPEAQSPSDTDSVKIKSASPARTLQQDKTEADNPTARQSEVLYERSETNEREKDRSFDKYWEQIELARAQTDSDDESEISISSHQTKTDNATIQKSKGVKFLEFVKWFCEFLPEVSTPDRKIELREKVLLTVIVLLIFMVCCQIPLFGITSSESVDRFYHMRVTRASHRGTPMEFGIMPIAESQFMLLMLTGFKIIDVHDTPNNHALLNGAQKVLALLLTVVLSILFIVTGMYGELEQIGVTFCLLITIQLLIAGLIILLLNGLVKKGYCLGPEISLFIVANICGSIMWKAFSPVTVYTDQGAEFEGAFVFLLHLFSTKKDISYVLRKAFLRQNLPNLMNFLMTIFVFVTVIYLKGFRVELPMKSTIHRGLYNIYPINLLYTSAAPLFLQLTFVPIVNLFSQVLTAKFNENFFVNLLGVWTVAAELKDMNMVMRGHREQSMIFELERYIPTAAIVGGLCIGTLSVLADFLGVYGSGTGVILIAICIYDYAELFLKEQNVNEEKIS